MSRRENGRNRRAAGPKGGIGSSGGGAPAVPFTPASLPNLLVWFDMQDAASYTQAGTVTSITNKASGVAWTEATNPPAYAATGLSGFPAMDFDGTNDIIGSTEAAVFNGLKAAAASTLYFVVHPASADRSDVFFSIGNSGVATNRSSHWGKSTTGIGTHIVVCRDDAGGGTPVSVESLAGTVRAVPQVICVRRTATTVTLNIDTSTFKFLNAVSFVPGATQTPNRSAMGCRYDSTPDSFYDGAKGEMVGYAGAHDDATVATMVTYLTTKWAIAHTPLRLFEGDSIMNGFGASGPVSGFITSTGTKTNLASNGMQAQTIAAALGTHITPSLDPGNPLIDFNLLIGSNDLATGDGVTPGDFDTPAEVLTSIATIVAYARSISMRCITGTILDRQVGGWGNNPDFNGAAATTNAALIANAGGIYGDAIVDTNTAIVNAGGYSLYIDNTHPDTTGTQVIATTFQAAAT